MATIEPRLIHLLNESTTPQLGHVDLPSLQAVPQPLSPANALPPLDPDTHHRFDNPRLAEHSSHAGYSLGTGEDSLSPYKNDGPLRHSGSNLAYPLRPVWPDSQSSEQSLAAIRNREDGHDLSDDSTQKKRVHGLTGKDDFVQLPQPLKKQKATQQSLAMPPIINGLHEPPPHAALFPPISSNSFEEADSTQATHLLHDMRHTPERRHSKQSSPEFDKYSNKIRKRAVKPRRKWSEEETKHLLLGVNRHGVGKWTSILEDTEFKFNERTAGDLKDRFRTCCPDELRSSNKASPPKSPPQAAAETASKAKTGILSENILIADPESPPSDSHSASQQDSAFGSKQKKSRAHRKKMTDLAELGIHGPFKKSHRRERHPFTDHDDREILEGLDTYGPAWTKIQRDPRFNFASRQPTDLRDRVRNKYPEIYQRIEKGIFRPRDGSGNDAMDPSLTAVLDGTPQRSKVTTLEPHYNGSNSRDDLPRWSSHGHELLENRVTPHGHDQGESSAPHHPGGEMGISRLLLR